MSAVRASPPLHAAVREAVRRSYARAATCEGPCAPRAFPCVPHSGLGCGTPTSLARLAPGESVLDLGSGAGFDCLAAALEVGPGGRVVGVDMTAEMVRLARRNAFDAGVPIVHFLQAEVERLPFADARFDVVLSNCVINLCPDKAQVFAEACRVLKPGGRLAVADVVSLAPLPPHLRERLTDPGACVAAAADVDTLAAMLRAAGFAAWTIGIAPHSRNVMEAWAPQSGLHRFVAAAEIQATRPDVAEAGRSPLCGEGER